MITSTKRLVETNGVQLQVTEAGDRGAPVVVLAHGFPELAHSWRHLAGLLDDVGAERAVMVGHDWGSPVVCNFALLHPDRVRAVAALSVPPVPRASAPPTEIWRRRVGDNYSYMLYFQEPGVADAALGRDPYSSMRRMVAEEGFAAPPDTLVDHPLPPLPDWLTEDEFEPYVTAFTESGFTGPLNWYRNFDRNWELTETTPAPTITVPTLFVAGSADPVLTFTPRDRVRDVVAGDYREVMIDSAGHWLQQERPDEVNAVLIEFIEGLK
ncbi:alpha/beta fold hydrolase [Mycolicibacterium mucogenicum]|uniref:alpha/beta fold hydrolase n=1 Tax=Mycolicibacterium mucogenicum TaxID=56689 RepID=UPI000A75E30D|nr:alpha/beta hydrolase [Mycolicibacterium mucogenicum]